MDNKCCHCGVSEEERTVVKCVICFRYYCKECGFDRGGRPFCTKQCSQFFFFGDGDDD